jgi:DNA-binding transcriptional ArsR family regulator
MEKNKRPAKRLAGAAKKLKVCGHPIRLALLCAIEAREPCVSDLWQCLEEPQPVVSQHLAVLKREGIVASRVKGNRRIYSVTDPWVRELIRTLPTAGFSPR